MSNGIANGSSGGIRSSIKVGNITIGDVMTVMPFESTFDTLSILGKDLRKAFERSVSKFEADESNTSGRFLQVSGFKVTFDVTQSIGSRVRKVETLCLECDEDIYEDLDEEMLYPIIASNYIANGGDGYASISEHKKHYTIGELDTDVFQDYLVSHNPVNPQTEDRIIFVSGTSASYSIKPLVYIFLYSLIKMLAH